LKQIMKTILSLLFVITLSNLTIAQPTIEWQKCLGGSGYDDGLSIQQTTDGGYIVVGQSNSTNGDVTGNHGNIDYWVVKLDNIGVIEWQRSLGGTGYERNPFSIQQTIDGGYIISGYSGSNDGDVTGNIGGSDCWVVKLDSIGFIEWQKSLGGTGSEHAYSIQQTIDGGYILGASSNSTDGDVTSNQGGFDYWVVKLDSIGTIVWQKSLGGSNQDRVFSIQQTSDGGYIVAGECSSNDGDVTGNHGSFDYWLVKLDSIGNMEWQRSLGGTGSDKASSIKQTSDGGYIVTGSSTSNDGNVTGNHGSVDYWLVKLDSIGTMEWQKCLGGSSPDHAFTIQQTNDGGYIVAGWTMSTNGDVTGNHGDIDYWIVKITNLGGLTWQKSLGGTGEDGGISIQQTIDGGYITSGWATSFNGDVTGHHGGGDMWVVKLSPFVAVGVNETNQFRTIKTYPNPTNGIVSIDLGEVKKDIKATLTNSLGQVILTKNYTSTNFIDLDIDAPKGIYFLQLESNREVITKKIIKE
jgi:hypothetical protein